jgi:hypothetical protein
MENPVTAKRTAAAKTKCSMDPPYASEGQGAKTSFPPPQEGSETPLLVSCTATAEVGVGRRAQCAGSKVPSGRSVAR